MTVHLFQDVAGTIPAILPGQPVGFIKRTKGSDDAKQATALSKPTYARYPRTGRRNLLGYNEPRNSELGSFVPGSWAASGALLGDSGDTFNGYRGARVIGQGQDWHRVQSTTINEFQMVVGDVFTTSAIIKRGLSGKYARLVFRNESAVTESNARLNFDTGEIVQTSSATGPLRNLSAIHLGNGCFLMSSTVTVSADGLIAKVGVGPASMTAGDDVIVYAMQLERSEVATAIQRTIGVNNITETGVPDLWHLYNDGGDSLNVTLPAGTYGLASIGIDRQIIVTTFVSDGTTPVNILRHERQLDVCYRLGAYSAAEELAIRDAWGRKYA